MPQPMTFAIGFTVRLTRPKISATRTTVQTVGQPGCAEVVMPMCSRVLSQTARADPARGSTRLRSRLTMRAIVPQRVHGRYPCDRPHRCRYIVRGRVTEGPIDGVTLGSASFATVHAA